MILLLGAHLDLLASLTVHGHDFMKKDRERYPTHGSRRGGERGRRLFFLHITVLPHVLLGHTPSIMGPTGMGIFLLFSWI